MKNEYKKTMRQLNKARRQHGVEKSLGQGLQDLIKAVNKHFETGACDWKPRDVFIIMGYGADIRDQDFLLVLKQWETSGWIQIVDTPVCLFRTLQKIPEKGA
jgi:hypothetical protein